MASAITPEADAQPQEQVIETSAWLQIAPPPAGGVVRIVIDSGRGSTTGFAMEHGVNAEALRGMTLHVNTAASGASTSAVTGAGDHLVGGVLQDVLGFVRYRSPAAVGADTLNATADGGHWRSTRTIAWERIGESWQGSIAGAISEREPGTSSGSESGTVVLRTDGAGALEGATVAVQRDLSITSDRGTVLVRQTIRATLARIP